MLGFHAGTRDSVEKNDSLLSIEQNFYFVQMLGLLDFHVILEKMEVLVLEKVLHQV